jgi:hypothetical protein
MDVTEYQRAALDGDLPRLIQLHNEGKIWDHGTIAAAIQNDHVECLDYLIKNGCPTEFDWFIAAGPEDPNCHRHVGEEWMTLHATIGQHKCLEYLIQHGYPFEFDRGAMLYMSFENFLLIYHTRGIEKDPKYCLYAGACGRPEILRFLHEEGFPYDDRMLVEMYRIKNREEHRERDMCRRIEECIRYYLETKDV